ncbi:hypothetical protein JHL21_02605 [Devosia sp. WQ 349]|nr:hypothetical protein [Devosia sp. WQ 349K1]
MSELAFVQNALHSLVAPPSISSDMGARIRFAASKLGWSFSRTRTCWYGDERVALRPAELRKIEHFTGVVYDPERTGHGRRELAEIDALMSRAEALLERGDEDFYRSFVAGLSAYLGAFDRARTQDR